MLPLKRHEQQAMNESGFMYWEIQLINRLWSTCTLHQEVLQMTLYQVPQLMKSIPPKIKISHIAIASTYNYLIIYS